MRKSRKRILRRSVEVDRDESKECKVNWMNVLWFPGWTVFSATDPAVVERRTHPMDEASVIENLHDG